MTAKTQIPVLVDEAGERGRAMLPGIERVLRKVVQVEKKAVSRSLALLIQDVEEIVGEIPQHLQAITPRTLTVAVQIGADGGISWIGAVKAGVSSSMTLTFELGRKNR